MKQEKKLSNTDWLDLSKDYYLAEEAKRVPVEQEGGVRGAPIHFNSIDQIPGFHSLSYQILKTSYFLN